ncbi:MAG: UDP-N-acetylglucosamine 1-carboxyvinyltransferase [bacterium]
MDNLVIEGGRELKGEVRIAGAKNAALPLMAAAILAPGQTTLHNVPDLADVSTMASVLEGLGIAVSRQNDTMTFDASTITSDTAPYELVKTMRASFYALGALIGRLGRAKVSLPGGCAWGPRPVDIHLKGLEALGVKTQLDRGYILADARKMRGNRFVLDFPSVGASVNLLLAAVAAKGETILENVAREPEVTNLTKMLIAMGAPIEGAGSTTLHIEGGHSLNAVDFRVIPDRIEAGTYLAAVGRAGGDVTLVGANPDHFSIILDRSVEAGLKIAVKGDRIRVQSSGKLHAVDIQTEVYPGFATDMQAQWIALMTGAEGSSLIEDTIYPDRFTHVPELIRLGANIIMRDNIAQVTGPTKLVGAPVMSTDLRASASLVIAALAAKGRTEISRIYHLDRGYEQLEEKFANLGAKIWREEE